MKLLRALMAARTLSQPCNLRWMINSITSPFLIRHHQIRQVNPPRPKRLHLIRQVLVGIEHGLDRAVEVALVVVADRVEHVAASGSASRPVLTVFYPAHRTRFCPNRHRWIQGAVGVARCFLTARDGLLNPVEVLLG